MVRNIDVRLRDNTTRDDSQSIDTQRENHHLSYAMTTCVLVGESAHLTTPEDKGEVDPAAIGGVISEEVVPSGVC